jgi:Ca-activated chloride channel family protein
MTFTQPDWLLLAPLALVPWWRDAGRARLAWPAAARLGKVPRGLAGWPRFVPLVLRTSAIGLIVAALARPQTSGVALPQSGRGLTIVLALDNSRTMSEEDMAGADGVTSRLDAARRSVVRFIERRANDLIGLVSFANYPDTTCPPTLDHAFLIESVNGLPPARAADAGTNLGDALAWALRDARDSQTARGVVVLITDGANEPSVAEPLDPLDAARLARQLGIPIHVIATLPMAARGESLPPVLPAIAGIAGGQVGRATDLASLDALFDAIDRVETTPFTANLDVRRREWFPACVLIALTCLGLEFALSLTRLRQLP